MRVGRWAICECGQAGHVTSAPFQALARSLGLRMPVVVQSMYIFKVSSPSSPGLHLPSVKWAQCSYQALPYKGRKLPPRGSIIKLAGERENRVSSG